MCTMIIKVHLTSSKNTFFSIEIQPRLILNVYELNMNAHNILTAAFRISSNTSSLFLFRSYYFRQRDYVVILCPSLFVLSCFEDGKCKSYIRKPQNPIIKQTKMNSFFQFLSYSIGLIARFYYR